MKKLEDYIRTVPDFPKKGIMFRDITAVLQDKEGLKLAIDSMEKLIKDMGATVIAGAEARGFLLGMPVAYNLNLPFVPVRKKGKLNDLLGTLRCAGIGKIPDWLIVLANNIDNLVVVLVSQAVGLNPDHIGIANQVCIGRSLPVNEAH